MNSRLRFFSAVCVIFLLGALSACAPSMEEIKQQIYTGQYELAVKNLSPLTRNKEALYILASLYHYGLGVEKNQQMSNQLMLAAAKRGWPAAQFNAALLLQQNKIDASDDEDQKTAAEFYEDSAEKGFAPAMNNLGKENLYKQKNDGIDEDHLTPTLWSKATELNDPYAQYNLAVDYFFGLQHVQSFTQARKYFLTAEKLQVQKAKFFLGLMNYHGWGGEKNVQQTYRYWKECLEQPDPQILQWLANFFQTTKSLPHQNELHERLLDSVTLAENPGADAKKSLQQSFKKWSIFNKLYESLTG